MKQRCSYSLATRPERVTPLANKLEVSHVHAVLGDLPAAIWGALEHTNLLQSLDNISLHTGSGISVVTGSGTSPVLRSVEFGKGSDTNRLSEVDVSGDGSWEIGQRCLCCSVAFP